VTALHALPSLGDVTFSLANREDDAAIRALLARNPMPGRIQVRYEREPDYFAGCATMGETQVLVARADGQLVGVACRAVRPVYVNGVREEIGYLGQLRVDRNYRGRFIVLRGFGFLHQLHRASHPRGYVTTIVEGNGEAEGVLVQKARGPMPRYRKLDRLFTLALRPKPVERRPLRPPSVEIKEILSFLAREGPNRNFFPVHDAFDTDATRDFNPADFAVVHRDGEIAGVAGLWDQSAYKQSIVHDYDAVTRFLRPLYNVAAPFLRKPSLPRTGDALRFGYGSFFCVRVSEESVARELVTQLLGLAHERGLQHLLLGFTESDPLLAMARSFPHVAYPSGVYTVAWDGETDFHDQLDARPRYLELASL
jgi:hypothetical protein